ncbi:MAG: sigma 54-interacting transcriptional regulator [Deltaproteobacteria bacterium]|nr:sigma 54-interacting transcriptional regulator [Deltaproteobacteria bacterium]
MTTTPLSDDDALRAIVEGVEAEIGDRFFVSLVEHLAAALRVRYSFVTFLSADRQRFRTLAVWGPSGLMDNLDVPVRGTPCEAVLSGETSHHPAHLQQLFPEDVGLADWRAESYCGVPIADRAGTVLGHLAIFDDKPMHDARGVAVMRIFAARASAEFERLRMDRALRESQQRLASILDTAMDAIVTFDAARRVALFNRAAEQVFACPASAALGEPVDRLLGAALLEAVERGMAAGSAESRGSDAYLWAPGGLTARRGDGSEFPVEATLSYASPDGGALYTLILRDVDERRRAEAELRRLHLESEYLQEEIRAVHNTGDVIGNSRALREVLDKVALVADTESSVLILGETGSGKELIARAVHAASRRAQRPLIKVNCAALPSGLIESELFGHERGAFTGATEKRVGRFELAAGGSIFLDEIGDMPLDTQAKLLRILQEREFERVGGSKTLRTDVRVIAATNRDLAAAVAAGSFRQDLFYRLNVFPIVIPPLRERPEDIPLLVHYFVARYAQKSGRRITHVAPEVMRRLLLYGWPGNVRELENVVERAVILANGPELNLASELPTLPASPPAAPAVEPVAAAVPAPAAGETIEDVERQHIAAVLRQTSWRIEGDAGAARLLGLNPSTLRSRIKKLGLRRGAE